MESNWFTELFINEAKPAMQRHSGGDTSELAAQIAEQAATISQQASTIEDLNENLETANSTIATKTSELETANDTISEQSTQITELETWKSENMFASEFLKDRIQSTNMSYLFYECRNLTSIPLLDTSKVKMMSNTFCGCSRLTSVPLFDTSSVTNMAYMFERCTQLISVPLFDTSSVKSIMGMFRYDSNLTSIPLLDTSKVTSMNQTFYGCENLASVPCLDARNVTNLTDMFVICTNLTDCYLRNIKTNLQVGSGTRYGHLLTLDSLKHLLYELRDTGSQKTLTVGSANLEKLATVYVKTIDITDEMRAEDDLIDEKHPFEVCESTDEGAMLITDYANAKNWAIA